jgi:hypothetical protein
LLRERARPSAGISSTVRCQLNHAKQPLRARLTVTVVALSSALCVDAAGPVYGHCNAVICRRCRWCDERSEIAKTTAGDVGSRRRGASLTRSGRSPAPGIRSSPPMAGFQEPGPSTRRWRVRRDNRPPRYEGRAVALRKHAAVCNPSIPRRICVISRCPNNGG